ncbi:MAG: O-antigen ligase family protein [Pseudomonadota bacterium]
MQNTSSARERLCTALAVAWLAVFLFLALFFSSARPAPPPSFWVLALVGMLQGWVFQRDQLFAVLRSQWLLLGCALLTVLALFGSGAWLTLTRPAHFTMPLPPHIGMLLCIAPMAVMLSRRRGLQVTALVLAAVVLVHLVALPWEALSGEVFVAGAEALYPRDMPPLHFQAHGLAWQVYYFPGLMMASFYLAAGVIGEERQFGPWRFSARSWLAASLVWAAAIACLQSRSALAGALASTLLGAVALAHTRRPRLWLGLLAVGVVGAMVFAYLFSANKSSGALRAAYVALYFRHGFDAEWLWTGRGYTIFPALDMQVPGLQYLDHSHNDFAQVLFTWGIPGLAAYLAFWAALLRLVWQSWRQGRHWPALALLACAPSFYTDLGLHFHEKVSFLVVLAAMAVACATPPPLRRR